jgi:hypothetical protein
MPSARAYSGAGTLRHVGSKPRYPTGYAEPGVASNDPNAGLATQAPWSPAHRHKWHLADGRECGTSVKSGSLDELRASRSRRICEPSGVVDRWRRRRFCRPVRDPGLSRCYRRVEDGREYQVEEPQDQASESSMGESGRAGMDGCHHRAGRRGHSPQRTTRRRARLPAAQDRRDRPWPECRGANRPGPLPLNTVSIGIRRRSAQAGLLSLDIPAFGVPTPPKLLTACASQASGA